MADYFQESGQLRVASKQFSDEIVKYDFVQQQWLLNSFQSKFKI